MLVLFYIILGEVITGTPNKQSSIVSEYVNEQVGLCIFSSLSPSVPDCLSCTVCNICNLCNV